MTFGYNLVADGSGGFGFDFAVGGAVPEPSTWAMMLLGFAGLGVQAIAKPDPPHRSRREPRDFASKAERAPKGAVQT